MSIDRSICSIIQSIYYMGYMSFLNTVTKCTTVCFLIKNKGKILAYFRCAERKIRSSMCSQDCLTYAAQQRKNNNNGNTKHTAVQSTVHTQTIHITSMDYGAKCAVLLGLPNMEYRHIVALINQYIIIVN